MYSQCMPRVHLMSFEPTGNTCALLLARAFGTLVALSPAHAEYQARKVAMCNNSWGQVKCNNKCDKV